MANNYQWRFEKRWLPLGLPQTDEFWSAPPERWTSQKMWSGENLSADHAMTDVHTMEVPTLTRPG